MTSKQARKIHRDTFTKVEEHELKDKTVEKERVKNRDYKPFKEWFRTLGFSGEESLSPKLERIRETL
jgi:hypothetical protein